MRYCMGEATAHAPTGSCSDAAGHHFRVCRVLSGIEPAAAPAFQQVVDAVERPAPIVAGDQDLGLGTAAHGDRVAV